MSIKLEPLDYKRSSRRRLMTKIERVFDDLESLEINSPKEVTKQMAVTFNEIATMREKIRNEDLNSDTPQDSRKNWKRNDKIDKYIETKYKNFPIKDSKRIVETLQNHPLTFNSDPKEKLLFNSMEKFGNAMKNNKRKFGESRKGRTKSSSVNIPENTYKTIDQQRKETPRNLKLTKFITNMMTKNFGINEKALSMNCSPKSSISSKVNSEPVSPKNNINTYYIGKSLPVGGRFSWGIGMPTKFEQDCLKSPLKFRNSQIVSTLSNAISSFQTASEEISIEDEEIYGPEYFKFLTNLDTYSTMQKYIGQMSEKKRKIKQKLSKFSKV